MQPGESAGLQADERFAALRSVQARRQELLLALRALDEEDRRLRLGDACQAEERNAAGAGSGEVGGVKRSGGALARAESNGRAGSEGVGRFGREEGGAGGTTGDAGRGIGGGAAEAGCAGDSGERGSERLEEARGADGAGGLGFSASHGMSAREVLRYSRQLMLPSFGVEAQQRLRRGAVLVVGAGGLGSPAALYLAGCGVGRIGIVDRDEVELSNLHRQIIHSEATVGQPKTASAAAACSRLNSDITVETHANGFTPSNALQLVSSYDVVMDASDNVSTRYLISDAAVAAGKPLVSGAALGTEGQLTVYNGSPTAPCYRCLFPSPPPASACQRCSDSGVLGVVPGVIGCLQALEALKLLAGVGEPLCSRMLVYDALAATFLCVKLRGKVASCEACGGHPSITAETIPTFDYEAFTSSPFHDQGPKPLALLLPNQRVPPSALLSARQQRLPHLLLDVRPPRLFSLAALPAALNTPLATLPDSLEQIKSAAMSAATSASTALSQVAAGNERELSTTLEANQTGSANGEVPGGMVPVYVVCRRGNDSQRAVRVLREAGIATAVSVDGGMMAWGAQVDPSFPAL